MMQLKELNPEGEAFFIKKDLTLLKHVDEVCAEIKHKEMKINILFITCGFLSMSGRTGEAVPFPFSLLF